MRMTPLGLSTIKKFARLMMENRFKNIPAMDDSNPINALQGRYRHRPAVIVAAGPSLDKNIHQLDHLPGRAIVLAVNSALAPMAIAENVRKPDFIVAADPQDVIADSLLRNGVPAWANNFRDERLIYIPEVTPKIPSINFKNKYYAYHGATYAQVFDDILGVKCMVVPNIDNVSNLALWAAIIMGCDPIVFVGHDFCFAENGQDHATGTVNHGGNRQTEKTNVQLLSILDRTEALIRECQGRRTFVNATAGGLDIAGTVRIDLENLFCRTQLALAPSDRVERLAMKYGGLLGKIEEWFIRQENGRDVSHIEAELDADPMIMMLTDLILADRGSQCYDMIDKIKNEKNEKDKAILELQQHRFVMFARRVAIYEMLEVLDG